MRKEPSEVVVTQRLPTNKPPADALVVLLLFLVQLLSQFVHHDRFTRSILAVLLEADMSLTSAG